MNTHISPQHHAKPLYAASASTVRIGPTPVGALLLMLFAVLVPMQVRAQVERGAWTQVQDLEGAGWSADGLARARELAIEQRSGAVFVVHHGHVVAAWGDVTRPFKMASARKSLVSAVFGIHVTAGTIDLSKTLADLGIEDLEPLSESERRATVADLLRARSGVYHPAAYEPASMSRRRPARGSAEAGARWHYNNWDFNTLGTIFEQEVGRELFAEFESRIARPLGMEDFELTHTLEYLAPTSSRHPAHLFRLSARDLARFGQLYLQRGRWAGQTVVSEAWVEESTRIHSEFPPGNPYGAGGYGYLWWVYPAAPDATRRLDAVHSIVARGNGGQVLSIIPEHDLVLVHCGDWYHERGVSFENVSRIFEAVLQARLEPAQGEPKVGPLDIVGFEHSLPGPRLSERRSVPAEIRDALVGRYRISPEMGLRVHVYEGRLFAQPLGVPLAELELFANDRGLYSPLFPLQVEVIWQEPGVVEELRVQMGPQAMVATPEPGA